MKEAQRFVASLLASNRRRQPRSSKSKGPWPLWVSQLADHVLFLQQPKHNSYAVLLGRGWSRLCKQFEREPAEHEEHFLDRIRTTDSAQRTLKQIERAALLNDAKFFEDFSIGLGMDERADKQNLEAIRRYKWMIVHHAEVDRCGNFDKLNSLLYENGFDKIKASALERIGRKIGLAFRGKEKR